MSNVRSMPKSSICCKSVTISTSTRARWTLYGKRKTARSTSKPSRPSWSHTMASCPFPRKERPVIRLETKDRTLRVTTPYHPSFPELARNLGGKWEADTKTWRFDVRDAERVKLLCKRIYGYGDTDLVTIRIAMEPHQYQRELWLCGRQIAIRRGRDSRVSLGEGVVLIAGGFPASGGSMKYPTLSPNEGTVLEVRDVPRSLVTESETVTILEPPQEPTRRIRHDGNDQEA